MLSFDFYPKVVYFVCKFWISYSAITHVETDQLDLRGLDSGKRHLLTSLKCSVLYMYYIRLKAQKLILNLWRHFLLDPALPRS